MTPRALERHVADVLGREGLAGARLLVAVSGGVDSAVLLTVLHGLARALRLELSVGHVHHGLRGCEADRDASAVRERARELGLPFHLDRVHPEAQRDGHASRTRPTLQEAARQERYAALLRRASILGADVVTTAHTLDDQAETVLLRVLRGCGPRGLAGIPVRSFGGRVVRPMLGIERSEVLAYAAEQAVRWLEDGTNARLHYARNRLRRRWLPGLARDFNPRLLRSLARLAEVQQRDAAWLDAIAEREAAEWLEQGGEVGGPLRVRIRRGGWEALPPGLATRLVRTAWLQAGGAARDLRFVHLERARRYIAEGRPGSCLELPGGLALRCEPHTAWLSKQGGRDPRC